MASAAETSHPVKQGLVQALSVYIVSFIVCTSTAIILLLSMSYNVAGPDGGMLVEYLPGSQYGVGWTQDILEATYGGLIGGSCSQSSSAFLFLPVSLATLTRQRVM